jgi:hypothetical protein
MNDEKIIELKNTLKERLTSCAGEFINCGTFYNLVARNLPKSLEDENGSEIPFGGLVDDLLDDAFSAEHILGSLIKVLRELSQELAKEDI